jgi:DNA-binding response OmpR family regulator
MHVLLIDEQQSLLSFHLARVLEDRHLLLQVCSKLNMLADTVLQHPPDLVIVILSCVANDDIEQQLKLTLLILRQNLKTISTPVIVIIRQPVSKELLHQFQVQIKAVFVQPFLISEFVATVEQFHEP